MSPRRSLRFPPPLALCLALLSLSAGCSFVFVDGPPPNHKKLPFFTCTPSNTLPIVDLVIGGVLAASTVGELDNGSSGTSASTTTVAVAVGEAALFAASAIYGFGKTSACREANAELMARLPAGPISPPGFAPGYAPQPQVPYDPWVSPPPGAFAAPPQPLPPVAPAPAKPAPAAPNPPAVDDESPHSQGGKP